MYISKLDQSQDIVTGNAYMSSQKSYQLQTHQTVYIYGPHIPVHQFRNDFIKKHLKYIKYLTKNLVPNHCTSP